MPRTLVARHQRFPLKSPFRISRGVKTEADVVTVMINDGDATGLGEGVPYARYGESIESSLDEMEEARAALEAGADRQQLLTLMKPGAARNAVDCALWDLEAKLSGRSVADIIGAPQPGRIATALTVVIDTSEAMAATAAGIANVPLIKVKLDANDPEAALRAVRAAAPNPRLIADPNESWDEELLRAMEPLLVELRADLIEQPVKADEDEWLKGFKSRVPILADEAVHVAGDMDSIAARYQAINVKLDKTGGLTAALDLAAEARARGMTLMTGCMVCSSLSIAPALHIARMSDFADLDGPLWLKEDRDGGVSEEGGWMDPPAPDFWGMA